jgi:hypothetical protein
MKLRQLCVVLAVVALVAAAIYLANRQNDRGTYVDFDVDRITGTTGRNGR